MDNQKLDMAADLNLTGPSAFTDTLELMARNVAISIIANLINAFAKAHKFSDEEIAALQKAIDKENERVIELADKLSHK